jgi:hypothetical protein
LYDIQFNGLQADEALEKLRATLQQLSSSTPPKDLGFEETGASGEKAEEGIKGEGEAAAETTAKKEELAKANKVLAETMTETGAAGTAAASGIDAEGEAVEKVTSGLDK